MRNVSHELHLTERLNVKIQMKQHLCVLKYVKIPKEMFMKIAKP